MKLYKMPDCAVQGFVIGQTVGGCMLGILRIEIKHVNCKTCVHQISEIGLMEQV